MSLYLQGCDKPVKCAGCHNKELQRIVKDENPDMLIDTIIKELEIEIEKYKDFYNTLYLSFLGGEPLSDNNSRITLEVSKYFKENYGGIVNVLYSWRDKEIIEENKEQYIKYMDYGVLGGFIEELKEENTIPSSSNQYIWDFNNKIKIDKIILHNGGDID